MRKPAISSALLLLVGCGGDPWVGHYEGTQMTEARTCAGDPLDPTATDISVRIERDEDGLFINGRCLIRLDELTATSARVIATRCDAAAPDGTPLTLHVVSGRAERTGDELALEYSAEVTDTAGTCVTALTTFVGYR